VFAALAEFERDLVRERTSAGLAAARARGRHGGRPSVLTAHKLQVAQEMFASGQYTVAVIAKTLGVSRASIYRHLGRLGDWPRRNNLQSRPRPKLPRLGSCRGLNPHPAV
jgi:DNA invertase Pin-like site-specific DNA recombinase